MRSEVGGAESDRLYVNALVWGGGGVYHPPTSLDLLLLKCTLKGGRIILINDLIDPLKTLQLLV